MYKIIFIIIAFLSINSSFAQFEEKNDSINKLYDRTINIANKLYSEKHYKESVAYYKSALKIKPEKKLAKFRIEDIITIFIKYDIASNRQEAITIIDKVEEKIAEEDIEEEIVLYDIPETIKKEEHIVADTIIKELKVEPFITQEEPKIKELKTDFFAVKDTIKEQPQAKVTIKKPVKKEEVKEIKKAKPVINQEEANKKMLTKYPDSKTTEYIKSKNKNTTKVVINKNNRVTIYLKVEHNWGGVYYFIDNSHLGINNISITNREFFDRTKD